MTSPSQALLQCSQQLHRAKTQLADVERASREGWRYADELEQERKRLNALNLRRLEALRQCLNFCQKTRGSDAIVEVILAAIDDAEAA